MAQLIHWANLVMLQGIVHDKEESKESVTTVIRAVLNGTKVRTGVSYCFCPLVHHLLSHGPVLFHLVYLLILSCPLLILVHQELVRLVAERQDSSTPLSPVHSQSEEFFEPKTSDSASTCTSPSEEGEVPKTARQEKAYHVGAPPKPPMLVPELPQLVPK